MAARPGSFSRTKFTAPLPSDGGRRRADGGGRRGDDDRAASVRAGLPQKTMMALTRNECVCGHDDGRTPKDVKQSCRPPVSRRSAAAACRAAPAEPGEAAKMRQAQ